MSCTAHNRIHSRCNTPRTPSPATASTHLVRAVAGLELGSVLDNEGSERAVAAQVHHRRRALDRDRLARLEHRGRVVDACAFGPRVGCGVGRALK